MGKVSRREFLRFGALGGVGLLAASCAPGPQPTQPVPAQATTAPAGTAAPQTTAAPVGEAVKLQYWHGWTVEHERQAMEDAVKLFNDAHPNIQVEPISGKTGDQVMTAVSGGNPPDAWSMWGGQTLAQWANTGVIVDVGEMIKSSGTDESLFYAASLELSRFAGKYYGLPIEIDPIEVYYNKDLFKAAGLDPEQPPKTMEELYDVAARLTTFDDQGNITQLGLADQWMWAEACAYMYGGRWWDPQTGQPTANDPGNVKAWTDWAALYQKLGADKIATFNGLQVENPLGSLFIAGKVGMAYDGDWITQFMIRFAPETDYGIFPLPPATGHDDRAWTTPIDGAIYVIPTGAKQPGASWEFIAWMATSKEAACILQKAWGACSPLRAVVGDAACAPNDRWGFFEEVMSKDRYFLWAPIAISAVYKTEQNSAADRVKLGQQTAQQALDELQAKMVDELKKATSQ